MLTMFAKEIWNRKISLIAYCFVGIVLVWLYVMLFPSIKASSAQFEKMFQSYPKGLYQALGIEELSFNTIEKFLSVELFSFMWPILAIVFALSRAGGSLAGEIEKGTMGLYLALPVSRLKIFFSKYASGFAALSVYLVFTVTSILPIAALYNIPANAGAILNLSLMSVLFLWAVFAAAMFLSAMFSERSKVYMVSGGCLLIMYAVNVVASLNSGLAWLHKTSVFYYYGPQDILSGDGLRFLNILVFVLAITLFSLLGGVVFKKRDIAV